MRLLDCTLRDGANVVGNGFSKELTLSMIRGLISNGITEIEYGNAKGAGSYTALNAVAPLTDSGYMELASEFAGKAHLGIFVLAKLMTSEIAKEAKDNGLSFLRIGAAAGDGAMATEAVKKVKEAGLYCRYSMMKGYILSPEELAEEAALLEAAGVDLITIMDSAGTMFPEEVSTYVKTMKQRVSIPIGFHGHSNLGLSQANALAAVSAGAEEIDCGLLGMARSAGNCSTELAVFTLQKEGYLETVNGYGLLHYLEEELIPAMEKWNYKPAVSPVDLILGFSGCHSSFLNQLKGIAEKEKVDLYRLIVEVSKINRKNPTHELMLEVSKLLDN